MKAFDSFLNINVTKIKNYALKNAWFYIPAEFF